MIAKHTTASNGVAEPSLVLPPEKVASILKGHDEECATHRLCYYPDVETLASQVRSSKNWAMGEVFVYVESATRYIVMKQIAPSSCEMLTITPSGIADVLTAYRFELDELVAKLEGFLEQSPA